MSKKIAAVDKQAMDALFAEDVKKIAATLKVDDLNGAPEDPQAFEDHEEYIATLENVLAEDKKNSFEPNDVIQD
jgi:hypothetical protein